MEENKTPTTKLELKAVPKDYSDLVTVMELREGIGSLNLFKPRARVLDLGCGMGYYSNLAIEIKEMPSLPGYYYLSAKK